jgi:S-adenosylmethionine:tRNA ribosyltransferase-isomerase
VFNQTRVIPARLQTKKVTGGRTEIFYLGKKGSLLKVLSNRKLNPKEKLFLNPKLYFKIVGREEKYYLAKPSFKFSQLSQVLKKFGHTPLPPYIKNSPLSEAQKRKEYQTVFAKTGESVAAPTAALHFTKQQINQLKKRGIKIEFINLDVNLGTFAPLKEKNLKTGKLHSENYSISKKTALNLRLAKKSGIPIIAVGTTSLRTLETYAKNLKLSGSTELFIKPGFKFRLTSGLITNFHVPQSSLLMLVAALVGQKKLMQIYTRAILEKFRFFSFGDGMLIL